MKRLLLLVPLLLTGCDRWKQLNGLGGGTNGTTTTATFAVFGQSNGVSPANGYTMRYSVTGHVNVNDYYCDRQSQAHDPICFQGMAMVSPTQSSPIRSNQTWLTLGDELYANAGLSTTFYNVSHGGSSTQDLIDHGDFDLFLMTLRAHPEIRVVLWVQGEAEAVQSAEESYQHLKMFIEKSKGIIPGLVWVVALDADGRAGQERVIAEGLALRGPDIDLIRQQQSLQFHNPSIEFEGPGHDLHAQAWFDTLQKLKPWNK